MSTTPEIPNELPPLEQWIGGARIDTSCRYWVRDWRGTRMVDAPGPEQEVVGRHVTETISGTVPGAHPEYGEVTWTSWEPARTSVVISTERDEFYT